MFTQQLPFQSSDPMEMIHSHIAKLPKPPHILNPRLPVPVSNIVMKLMSKMAEDRYQGDYGLIADLTRCLDALSASGTIPAFPLGKQDFSGRLQLSQKLYGREAEIKVLLDSFDRAVAGRVELILIAGYSGVGKSVLVREVHKPIVAKRGHFTSGKCDQFQRNIPYGSLVQALQDLIRQLLSEPESQLLIWKSRLLEALNTNGQVIIELLPELEKIIGPQPRVANLPAEESQYRFNNTFKNFVRALATDKRPLVIFLDDLQWADLPTLKLLKSFLSDMEQAAILIIGAYRDNEVDRTHPLMAMLDEVHEEGVQEQLISLSPLKLEAICELISDALMIPVESSLQLASLCYQKTQGNPFFLKQFLQSIYEEGWLTFDMSMWQWQWNVQQLESKAITDNVIDLIASKIQKLPEPTQEALKIAASIGNQFELKMLSMIRQQSLAETANDLWESLLTGLIIPNDDAYKFLRPTDQDARVTYHFLHDRVQQAAYALIKDDELQPLHLKIGRLLLENTPEQVLEEKLFDIVGQLNAGCTLIDDIQEKLRLSRLNLMAGKKAKVSAAYDGAVGFLRTAVALLPTNRWDAFYDFTLEIYCELAECEYLATHFEEANRLFEIVYKNAKTILDKMPIYHIQIRQKASEQKADEAFQIDFDILTQLGLTMPEPGDGVAIDAAFQCQLEEYQQLLGGRAVAELYTLPDMSNPDMVEAIRLITNLGDVAIAMKGEMLPLMSIMGINLSLKYGNLDVSSISYVMMGVITNFAFKDYKTGYELGQLALRLSQHKFKSDLIYGKVAAFYGWNIHHWLNHVKEDLVFAKKGFEIAVNNSDLVYASYYIAMSLQPAFYIGQSLDQVAQCGVDCLSFASKYRLEFLNSFAQPTYMAVLSLQGKTRVPDSFNSNVFSEADYVRDNAGFGQPMAYFYLRKMQVHYVLGYYRKSYEALSALEALSTNLVQHIAFAEFHFARVLVFFAVYPNLSKEEISAFQSNVDTSYEYLKLWATLSEDNFQHQLFLVDAEKAALEGREVEAMQLYDAAIESAKAYGYLQNAAIAAERAGIFFESKNLNKVALTYFKDAHYYYSMWGAFGKTGLLEKQIPHLIKNDSVRTLDAGGTKIIASTDFGSAELDLKSVIKASQAISVEIHIESLLEKLMKLVIEIAGAQKGYLLMEQGDDWQVVAHRSVEIESDEKAEQGVVLPASINERSMLPMSIIHYVARTHEKLVLNNARQDTRFAMDPGLQKSKPISVLCAPILYQGKLSGILYLENNLTADTFTDDQLEVLSILSSQAAISIENARLFDEIGKLNAGLEQKVAERTEELNQVVAELELANEELNSFSYTVSHDLRGPLRNIKGFANLIIEDKGSNLDPGVKSLATRINKSANKMSNLMDGLLELARMQRTETTPTQVNLCSLVSSVFEEMYGRYPNQSIQASQQIEGDHCMILADERMIQSVMENLIGNAWKYCGKKASAEVMFGMLEPSEGIPEGIGAVPEYIPEGFGLFYLKDTGAGFNMEMADNLFGSFQRLHTEKEFEGTGIGLATVKRVLEKHGGCIWAHAEQGLGASFYFTLPLLQAESE
ncbi:MAG: AAA family ATPase [Hahellaceae bacterium]|nr:AAA family ATPase [Hahellaceae bacterium]